MREIKFKLWHKGFKKFFTTNYSDQISMMPDGNIFWMGECETDNFTILQYTGLKDKNGKEIYEGDIVRGKYGKNGIVKNYEIRWLIGHFAAVDRNNITGDEHYYPIGLLEGEVIGNIYENKHLFEGVNNESK